MILWSSLDQQTESFVVFSVKISQQECCFLFLIVKLLFVLLDVE